MSDSTAQEKSTEFDRAWLDADGNYNTDMAAALGDADEQSRIEANWWRHHANWSASKAASLGKNSAAIEAAFQSAHDANEQVKAAREAAEGIAQRVAKSANAADALTGLLKAVLGV